MTTEQHDTSPQDGDAGQPAHQQQQQGSEGHAGQGSDSAMKQMRLWEQRRASQTASKGRQGAGN